jgi:hypothetical protein
MKKYMKFIFSIISFLLITTSISCKYFEESYKFDNIYEFIKKNNYRTKYIKIYEEDGETNLFVLLSDFKYQNTESSGFLFLKEVNDTVFFEEVRGAKKSLVFWIENNIGLPVYTFQYSRIDENLFESKVALKFKENKNNFSEEQLTKNLKTDSIFYLNNFPESIKRLKRFFIDKVNGTITRRVFLEYYSSNPLYSADFESLQYVSNSKIYIASFVYYHKYNETCRNLSKNGTFFYEVMRENIKYKTNFFNSNLYRYLKFFLLITVIVIFTFYLVYNNFKGFHSIKDIILKAFKKYSLKDYLDHKMVHISYFTWVFINTYFLIKAFSFNNKENIELGSALTNYRNVIDFFTYNYNISDYFLFVFSPLFIYIIFKKYNK